MSSDSHPQTKARGRPRSAGARAAILAAARDMIQAGGITSVTVEGIAARAGVGKPTIYRSWPNASAVAMAALMGVEEPSRAATRARSVASELKQQLRAMAEVFATRMGRQAAMLIASATAETELAKSFRNHFILARREEGRLIIVRALERRELRKNLRIEVVLDLIYGPVFYRLLMGHGALDSAFTDAIVEHVLAGVAAPTYVKR